MITRSLSALTFFVLSCTILIYAQAAFAERFNFDSVTLPTDLIADIVNIEDDIALDNREQSNRNAGIKVISPVETVAAEPSGEPETTTSSTVQIDNSSGSIFSNVDTETGTAPDLIVAETDTETVTEDAVALNIESQSSSGSIFSDIDSEEALESEISETASASETVVALNTEVESESNSIFSDIGPDEATESDTSEPATEPETTIAAVSDESAGPVVDTPDSENSEEVTVTAFSPAVTEIPTENEINIASNEVKNQPSVIGSTIDKVQPEPEEMPVLMVEQPVAASDAADIPQVLDESQGVIIVAESSIESAAESSLKVEPSEAETPAVTVQQEVETASEESVEAEPRIIASTETAAESETKTLAAADSTAEPAPSATVESDQVTETPATTEPKTEITSDSEPATESAAKTELAEKKLIELAENIETEAVAQAVTAEQEASINEDEIIIAWATAWSNNQTEDYLAFYADAFQPADKNLDRDAWEQIRRKRLQNKNIRIIVSNAEVFRVEGDIVEVRFTQRYTSSSYKDRVIKSIEMTETDMGWQFLSERTIKELPFE